MRLRLIENHEQLTRIARELVGRTLDHDDFLVQAASVHPRASRDQQPDLAERPRASRVGGYSGTTFPPETGISGVDTPASLPVEHSRHARPRKPSCVRARPRQTATRSRSPTASATPVFQAQIPLVDHGVFHGALLAEYSVERLLRYFVPDRDRAPPRDLAARRARALARQHGDDAAGRAAGAAVDRLRAAGRAGRERPRPARPGLPHLDRPDRQRACSGW